MKFVRTTRSGTALQFGSTIVTRQGITVTDEDAVLIADRADELEVGVLVTDAEPDATPEPLDTFVEVVNDGRR